MVLDWMFVWEYPQVPIMEILLQNFHNGYFSIEDPLFTEHPTFQPVTYTYWHIFTLRKTGNPLRKADKFYGTEVSIIEKFYCIHRNIYILLLILF